MHIQLTAVAVYIGRGGQKNIDTTINAYYIKPSRYHRQLAVPGQDHSH